MKLEGVHTKKRASHAGCPRNYKEKLNDRNIYSSGTFLALLNGESHAIALVERAKTIGIDAGMVNENVRTIFLLNEPIAFFLIEPLYNSVGHNGVLLS
jgi:hypothetical protein